MTGSRASARAVLDAPKAIGQSRALLSDHAEMGGLSLAHELIASLAKLDELELDTYFDFLVAELSPDPMEVMAWAQEYARNPCASALLALTRAVEPRRQELLRRLNRVHGGTRAVLRLRAALLRRMPMRPELRSIEADLLHLLSSWFNPGFLQMKRVDWHSPAQLLEKIIQHEAVHAIDGWEDLRRRLQPDRRCFAFFHPQLPEEPLIFVEVALVPRMPSAIEPLIDKHSIPLPPHRQLVAAFYSISNCEPGLRGISLGNFLIKQVAGQLAREHPGVTAFCTLSPIPGFAAWLKAEPDLAALQGINADTARRLQAARHRLLRLCKGDLSALNNADALTALPVRKRRTLERLCAAYLCFVTTSAAGDPVARFHLDNGARLERLNWKANASTVGIHQSFGLMVNYLYDIDQIESNHVRFRSGEIVRSRSIAHLV
jgi:malonyl-CoA decarboxylase